MPVLPIIHLTSASLVCSVVAYVRMYHEFTWLASVNVRGYEVTQLVEAQRYKPEGRGFDSQ